MTAGNSSFTTTYAYDEVLKTTVTSLENGNYTFRGYTVADKFGRTDTEYLKREYNSVESSFAKCEYTYVGGADNATSDRIAGVTYTTPYGTLTAGYTYDANGNILTITCGNVVYYSYEYDALNQLIREDDRVGDMTVVYTYDTNGNILTVSEGSVLKAKYIYDSLNQLVREDILQVWQVMYMIVMYLTVITTCLVQTATSNTLRPMPTPQVHLEP